jgi:hypothetical protein
MAKLQFKKITGFTDYSISSDGVIVSNRRGSQKILSPSSSTGYMKVALVAKDGTKGNFQVHRLVAMMFLKKRKNCDIVNHIDGDKLNNDVSNLEWTTRTGNAQHYEKKLAPKYRENRKQKKHDDVLTRLSVIAHARTACTTNPELFRSIVDATLQGMKV